MKKIIFLVLAMIAFSGCDKANSAECPDIGTQKNRNGSVSLHIRARDDISIYNVIINRGNCLYNSHLLWGSYYITRNGIDKINISGIDNNPNIPLTKDEIEKDNSPASKDEKAYEELNAGPKKLPKNIDLKFGEEESISIRCKPLEVVLETNLGQCEYKFD